MPSEVPNAEILDSATATSPEALSSLSSADVSLLQSTASSSASGIEKLSTFSPANVPHNLRPITLNATKDMYWFAHTGESSQGNGSEGDSHTVSHTNSEEAAAAATSPVNAAPEAAAKSTNAGKNILSPGHSESKDDSLINAQRDYELRIRNYKEMQEEERLRKLTELQMASHHAQRFREQQEEDRRKKIDELRSKDIERRHAVEERKRLIWEAEQERKEAILRRNLEREAKIEAKRNAQRNTMSIAFGSSTPREIDLPSGGMGTSRGSAFGSMMVLSSVNHPAEGYRKWNRSADVLNKDSDLSPSDHEYSPEVRMRNRDSENPSSQYNRRSFAGMSSEGARACLTIPENPISFSYSYSSLQAPSPCTKDTHETMSDDWLIGSRVSDPMTQSLVILPSNRGRRKTDLTPTIPWERDNYLRSASPGNITGPRSQAKRAVSMSRLDILAQPRRRPSANMDQTAQHPSAAGVNSKGLQKDMNCPSRPRSSQSMASEQSVASTVSMRSHSGPRRARPFSIAGSIIPSNPEAGQVHLPLPPQRRSRTTERKVPVVPPPTRPPRARSTGPDAAPPVSTPKAAPRKPPAAPKSASATPKVDKEQENQEPAVDEAPAKAEQEGHMANEEGEEVVKTEPRNEEVAQPAAAQPQPLIKSQTATPDSAKAEESKEGVVAGTKAPRITSEEEAKAALAEKRRLAREQAEREAELERQRQEALRREEEERLRKEEEEQRRMEEEQLRLAEVLRMQEEEKLQRAIEEQKKREEEEEARKEQENQLRLEKEEQERKLKEEAERQRKELEEKLKQEEAARAERKKRVEQIMKRTRAKTEDAPKSVETEDAPKSVETEDTPKAVETEKLEEGVETAAKTESAPVPANQNSGSEESAVEEKCENPVETLNEKKVLPVTESVPSEGSGEIRVNGTNNNEDSELKVTKLTDSLTIEDGLKEDLVNTSPVVLGKGASDIESMEVSADTSPQSNGYGSHDLNFGEISPDNGTKPSEFPLLDFTPEGGSSDGQWTQNPPSPPTEFDQLIDLSLTMSNQNEVNRLNNADELNSNRAPGIPFIAFEENNVTKKQESSITDLLS